MLSAICIPVRLVPELARSSQTFAHGFALDGIPLCMYFFGSHPGSLRTLGNRSLCVRARSGFFVPCPRGLFGASADFMDARPIQA